MATIKLGMRKAEQREVKLPYSIVQYNWLTLGLGTFSSVKGGKYLKYEPTRVAIMECYLWIMLRLSNINLGWVTLERFSNTRTNIFSALVTRPAATSQDTHIHWQGTGSVSFILQQNNWDQEFHLFHRFVL